MTDVKLIEAKMLYMNTGRLNQNVVNKEIAISWYKCKLQNMKTNDSIKLSKHEASNHFTVTFLNYIDSVVSEIFQYALANVNLQVCKSRINDSKIMQMNSIDDLMIGTNGGYNAFKNQRVQIVSKEEHFLDDLVKYYTIGIPINIEDKNMGTLMIISDRKPSEYEIAGIKDKLVRFYNKEAYAVVKDNHTKADDLRLSLDGLLNYPNDYKSEFQHLVDSKVKTILPILITGSIGCGKTTLAWYLSLKRSQPYYIDMETLPHMLQHKVLESALYQNETVLVDNIEYSNKQCLLLLTVYIEKKIDSITKSEHSKFKCYDLFLTTTNSTENNQRSEESIKALNAIREKLKISTINLRNLNDFPDHYDEIVEKMKSNCGISTLQDHLPIVKRLDNFRELHELLCGKTSLETVEFKVSTLEEQEKAYILNIYERMNHNVTLTAETLGIGRSTLYRKLEKYQNETVIEISKKNQMS